MLEIKQLTVKVEDKQVLEDINLKIKPGELHIIMGPNGAGKSSLSNTIMGNPKYTITKGKITLDGIDVTNKQPDF